MRKSAVAFVGFLLLLGVARAQEQPAITAWGNGVLTWSNSVATGYHSVEWSGSLTGKWYNTWQYLKDIPALPGETQRVVPMFYRVVWSSIASTSPASGTIPDVSGFSPTPGNNRIGLTWTTPSATNVVGVRIVKSADWFPVDPTDGTTLFDGKGNAVLDVQVENGSLYFYTAFTYDAQNNFSLGVYAYAEPADTTPPANVSGFTATRGDHQVFLRWQNPADNDFAGVKVVRSTAGPPTGPNNGTQVYVGLGTNTTDNGLTNGTIYYYKGYSFDFTPNYSIGSAAGATPINILPPDNIANLTVFAGDTYIVLTWINPTGGDFLGVRAQCKIGSQPTSISDGLTVYDGPGRSFTNLNLVNGSNYFYRVFSYDEVPNYSAGVITNATPADVTPPSNVTGFNVTPVPGNIALSWTNPPDADFAGVRIKRKTSGYPTNFADGFTVYQGAGTSAADTPLADPMTTNFYRIYAFDEVPNHSAAASGMLAPPPTVSVFSAVAGDQQVTLTWVKPVGGTFAGVRIQQKPGNAPTNAQDGVTIYQGNGTTYTNIALTNLTSYFFAAFSYDATPNYSIGVVTNSTPADVTSPASVTGFNVTPITGNISLAWTNPLDADFAGVRIQRKTSGYPTNFADGITIYQGAGTSAADTPLADAMTTNFYRIYAFDEVPNYSGALSVLLAPPATVSLLNAVAGDQQVALTWVKPVGGTFAGVRIQQKPGSVPTNAQDGVTVYQGNSTVFTNIGLNNLTTYFFAVFSYDTTPNYSTAIITNATPADVTAPSTVTAFTVSAVSGGIGLSWVNPPDNDFAGVRIQCKTAGYPTNQSDGATVFSGPGTNFVDNPLTDGIDTNFYRAFAFDEVPNYSGAASGLLPRPRPVTGFRAVNGDQQVTLSWTNPLAGSYTGVRLQRAIAVPPSNALDGVTVYQGPGTSFTNTGLANLTDYRYAAFSFDATPNYSAGVVTNAMPADTNAPSNVTQLVASSSNGTVVLSWVNPGDVDLAGVRLQRRIGQVPTNFTDGVTVFDGLDTTFTETGLLNGTSYCYRVFAYDEVPNYATGVSTTTTPLRVLFLEDFENAGGWTDHTNSILWSQVANSGQWVSTNTYAASGNGFYAYSDATYAHSGLRALLSYGSTYNACLILPVTDNPVEVRVWARTVGFSASANLNLGYYDGFTWYDNFAVTVNSATYSQFVFRPLLSGHQAQKLRLTTYSNQLYIDDVEIRVAP